MILVLRGIQQQNAFKERVDGKCPISKVTWWNGTIHGVIKKKKKRML